jgi:hypothetical protein
MKLHFLFQYIVSYFLIAHALVEAACPPEGENLKKIGGRIGREVQKNVQGRDPGVYPKDKDFAINKIVWPIDKELATCTKVVSKN